MDRSRILENWVRPLFNADALGRKISIRRLPYVVYALEKAAADDPAIVSVIVTPLLRDDGSINPAQDVKNHIAIHDYGTSPSGRKIGLRMAECIRPMYFKDLLCQSGELEDLPGNDVHNQEVHYLRLADDKNLTGCLELSARFSVKAQYAPFVDRVFVKSIYRNRDENFGKTGHMVDITKSRRIDMLRDIRLLEV